MAASGKTPPTPKEAVRALKYWMPALVAIVGAGAAAGIYASSKADRAELKEITEKLSWVKETLTRLNTQMEETEKRRALEVVAIVQEELAKAEKPTGGGTDSVAVKRASFRTSRKNGAP